MGGRMGGELNARALALDSCFPSSLLLCFRFLLLLGAAAGTMATEAGDGLGCA